MGFGDFLFGSDSDVQYKQEDLWNKGQKELFNQFFLPLLKGRELVTGPTEGPFGASLSALEQWAQNVYGGGAVTPGGQQAQESLTDLLTRGPSDISEYYQQTVEKPLLESFQKDIMPAISRKYAPSGFWSSQRTEAEDRARENLLDALARERARMAYQSQESDLARILQAGGILTGAEAGTRGDLLRLLSEGGQREMQRASMMLQALGLRPFENIATVTPGSTGLLQSMLGPAMSGLGTGVGYSIGPDVLKKLFG